MLNRFVLISLALCSGMVGLAEAQSRKIDAAVENNKGKVYLFSGSEYVRFDIAADRTDPGYPRKIAGNWSGMPWTSNIDAAASFSGNIIFFKGTEFLIFDIAADKAAGPPAPIADSFEGLPFKVVEAAFVANSKLYLFGNGMVARFDLRSNEADDGFPRKISAVWTGLAARTIDAAYNAGNGKGYLFYGPDYVRFNVSNNRIDASYPKKILGNWSGAWQPTNPIQIIDSTGGGA
jgi:hypothetical protein